MNFLEKINFHHYQKYFMVLPKHGQNVVHVIEIDIIMNVLIY